MADNMVAIACGLRTGQLLNPQFLSRNSHI